MTTDHSGHIGLDGDVIRDSSRRYGDWDLPGSALRILGECTNQLGPFVDDYFFCFATGPGMWLEAPFYAQGRDDFLRDLGAKLGSPLQLGLCNFTDFGSRVLWPASLAGQPMFTYTNLPAKGLLGRLGRLLGIGRNRQTYSDQVAAALANKG